MLFVIRICLLYLQTGLITAVPGATIQNESKEPRGGGGVLPYMGYIGMCRVIGYGF